MSHPHKEWGRGDRIAFDFCKASVCAILLGAMFGGCASPAASATGRDSSISKPEPARDSVVAPLTVGELVKLAGEPCETPLAASKCLSKEFDFEFQPDCASSGYYAAVSNPKGASVLNGAPPKDTIELAVLSQGQLVCVQAIARPGDRPSYLFVTAISTADTDSCIACKNFGPRKLTWKIKHNSSPCEKTTSGRYEGGCVTGWVDSEEMELLGKLK